MNKNTEQILQKLNGKKVGVFVDDSNLYHAYKKYSWRIDFGKLRQILERYCSLEFINYHVAIPSKEDAASTATDKFLAKIKPHVTFKTKPLKYIPVNNGFTKKADVDVEITLDVVRNITSLDLVIVMSGDSDLRELKNYVVKDKNKHIVFFAFEKSMAWELRYCWHMYVDDFKSELGIELKL